MDHDIKTLITKLNPACTNILHNAAGLCVSRTNYEITLEHFLLKSLEDPNGDVQLILRNFDIDPSRISSGLTEALEDFQAGNPGKPVFSPLLMQLLQKAWMIASIDMNLSIIRSGIILLAVLDNPSSFGAGKYIDIIKQIGKDELLRNFWNIVWNSIEQELTGKAAEGGEQAQASVEGGYLGQYCQNFTSRASEDDVDPVFGREEEINQIIDVLARRRKNNPILVGEPGVGKTAVIEGLALRIVQDDVPDMLKNVTLLGLDMGALQAGAGMKGEFENRLKGVLDEIKGSENPIILFIDEAHTLIGGGSAAGSSDAANLLKPALARGEIKTCAATTWSEYKKYFEKDPALARRFQLVKLSEPDVDTATLILRGLKDYYEASHNVVVTDEAIASASEYSDRYINGRFLPDKAIDLLDTSCARVKINLTSKPASINNMERSIQARERERKALVRDFDNGSQIDRERYEDIEQDLLELNRQLEQSNEQWQKEREKACNVLQIREELQELKSRGEENALQEQKNRLQEAMQELESLQRDEPMVKIEVDPDVIGKVVSDWTGIPLGKIHRDQAQMVLNLEQGLQERIKGQDHALSAMGEVVKAAKTGIKSPEQPLGVFLLVGPSGVGKTETGLALADLLFGGEHSMISINMSEFQEKHTTSRLIGSPPGYVGYGEGGMLTEAVRQNPYSVVLLDEVEKANPDVLNLFYQVFDKGVLTDGEGKEISFADTIIILTSNLGTDVIQEMTAEADSVPMDSVISAVRPLLSRHFKPALLARMTTVPYYALSSDAMRDIVELKLKKLESTLLQNNKIRFDYSQAVLEQITSRCTEVETGARNIDYILHGRVMPSISQKLLQSMSTGEVPSSVNLDVNEDGSFAVDFE